MTSTDKHTDLTAPDKAKAPTSTYKPLDGAACDGMKITVTANGPYIVSGGVPLAEDAICESDDGSHLEYHRINDFGSQGTYALCRCGHSKSMPFCDGTHTHVRFDGSETADKSPYSQRVDEYPGRTLDLLDDNRCAFARLCHRNGKDVWTLTEEAGTEEAERQAVGGSWNCPTGRLEHHTAETGEAYEQDLEPGITVLEDLGKGVSGPLFVHGGIVLIGSDGTRYELRNRYALCRCGESSGKPFCDAAHVNVSFNDGSESFNPGWRGERDNAFKDMPDKI